jgi:light-regulated signal transduction histidine kinase (bacteriophytochrome)
MNITTLVQFIYHEIAASDAQDHFAVFPNAFACHLRWFRVVTTGMPGIQYAGVSIYIELGSPLESKGMSVIVKDNGVGFNLSYTHKPFVGLPASCKAEEFGAGTGISLAIV